MKRHLFLLLLPFLVSMPRAAAQNGVSGRVTEADGTPMMGVVVTSSPQNDATMTDSEGRYHVEAGQNSTLEFSCLGFITVTEKVNGRAVVNVTMEEDVLALEETVVVGYGTMKKVNLTGSVSTISSESLDSRPLMNTSSGLTGLAAGMYVHQTTGKPGDDSATIRIRGITTLNTNSPLVLVDGIEWSMDNINTLDIESISVLKDASSTAIYGSRAAAGVILITTKMGDSKDKAKVNYSFTGTFQKPYNKFHWVSDYATYMELMNEAADNVGAAHYYSDASIETWKNAKADPYGLNEYGQYNYIAYPNTDWFDVIFNTGFSQQHNISVSGASDKIKYLMSIGYLDNEGVMNVHDYTDSSSSKIDFRVNLEAKVSKLITMGMKVFGTRQSDGLCSTETAFSKLNRAIPCIYPGSPNKWGISANDAEEVAGWTNIYRSLATGAGHDIYWRGNATAYFIFNLYKGLELEVNGNYSVIHRDRNVYTRESGQWDYEINERYKSSDLADATNTNRSGATQRTNTEILLRYNEQFGKHEVGGLFGFTTNSYQTRSFTVQKQGAVDWAVTEMSSYTTLVDSSSSSSDWYLMSFFGRIDYAYNSKYLFEANLRSDGSSRFARKSRWGVFPSVSAGWNMHKENWMKNATWLSNLKLRASFGVVGNNSVGNYSWQSTYDSVSVVYNGSETTGLAATSLSNEDLEWETTYNYNFGIDFGFFNGRLSGEADVYHKFTDGILYIPTPYYTMGYVDGAYQNLASVVNNGVEVKLNWQDKIGRDFHYGVGLTFAYNYAAVTKFKGLLGLEGEEDEDGNVTYSSNFGTVAEEGFSGYICEGQQLGEHYLYKTYKGTGAGYTGGDVDINAGPKDGIIRTEADMAWVQAMIDAGYTFCGGAIISKDELWYGDRLYQDLNGDGNYGDTEDREFNGHTSTPKYNVGITLNAEYKGFDFSAVLTGAFRFWLTWNESIYNGTMIRQSYAISKKIADDHYFYDPDNTSDPRTNIYSKYTALTLEDGRNNMMASDYYEYRGDYVKLKNIQLGYTLPKKLTQKFWVDKLRFFASMENIFTITSFPGMDPEIGTDINYPLMRSYAFGAQITF